MLGDERPSYAKLECGGSLFTCRCKIQVAESGIEPSNGTFVTRDHLTLFQELLIKMNINESPWGVLKPSLRLPTGGKLGEIISNAKVNKTIRQREGKNRPLLSRTGQSLVALFLRAMCEFFMKRHANNHCEFVKSQMVKYECRRFDSTKDGDIQQAYGLIRILPQSAWKLGRPEGLGEGAFGKTRPIPRRKTRAIRRN